MRYGLILMIFLTFSACSLTVESQTKQEIKPTPEKTAQSKTKQTVLMELFTSEGWSSCPSADRALATLNSEQPYANTEVITLAFHVDYWNYLGWKDEFSTEFFTQRQQTYADAIEGGEVYTPQMVVDGRELFVGGNLAKMSLTINAASKYEKGKTELEFTKDSVLKTKISELPTHQQSSVFVAIAEDNLSTDVKNGENGGRKLQQSSVVRELKSIGAITPEQKSLEIESTPQFNAKWKRENLRLVVFVQENISRKVIAVGQTSVIR